jgi:predicted DNA-binding transcriptional regulator AlpA
LIHRYVGGESAYSIAAGLAFSQTYVLQVLHRARVKIRKKGGAGGMRGAATALAIRKVAERLLKLELRLTGIEQALRELIDREGPVALHQVRRGERAGTSGLDAAAGSVGERVERRRLLRTRAAAEYLALAASTLEKARLSGTGPRFARLGRIVVYDVRDLDAWVSGLTAESTSQRPYNVRTGLQSRSGRKVDAPT